MNELTQLSEDYNQFLEAGPWQGIAFKEATPINLNHSSEIFNTCSELLDDELIKSAKGWLLTNKQRTTSTELDEEEWIIEGELWHEASNTSIRILFQNHQWICHKFTISKPVDKPSYLSQNFSQLGDGVPPLNYQRLFDAQGKLVAALFCGFSLEGKQ